MLVYNNGLIIVDYPEPSLVKEAWPSNEEIDRVIRYGVKLLKKYRIKKYGY